MSVLEPCAGEGALVEAVLAACPNVRVDAYELHTDSVLALKAQFKDVAVRVHEADTLMDPSLTQSRRSGGVYDRVIANPPYGAWIDLAYRRALRENFPGLYVRDTYAVFLHHSWQLLRRGGRLVFITPSTFLFVNRHEFLRRALLMNTAIEEISIFPSSFFPGVAFGYSQLSVISLRRVAQSSEALGNRIRVRHGFRRPEDLLKSAQDESIILQSDMLAGPTSALLLSDDPDLLDIIRHFQLRVADVADCVTGIYTGNDRAFLARRDVASRPGKEFIPLVKGVRRPFFDDETVFIDWSPDTLAHYRSDSKARFQNSQYYFRTGIAVPMVRARRLKARLMENRVFDQSIVGVFPRDERMLYWLLALFNSKLFTKMISVINPTANNSARYIGALPFAYPSAIVLDQANDLVQRILASAKAARPWPTEFDESLEDLIRATYEGVLADARAGAAPSVSADQLGLPL